MTADAARIVATSASTDEREWITASIGPSGYRTEIFAGPHRFHADEPVPLGGTGTGPTPYELLLGALGSCMAMTLRMYADRKRWPLHAVRIHLRTERAHEQDCEKCETEEVGLPRGPGEAAVTHHERRVDRVLDARVLVDTGMTDLHPFAAELVPRIYP